MPALTVSERFSDNIDLSPSDGTSGFVSQITPQIGIERRGARAKFEANYALDNIFYHAGNQSSRTNHLLRSTLNAELVDSTIYLDASASMQRAASSLLGTFGVDETTPGELSNLSSISVSPSWRFRHANLFQGEARYTASYVTSNSSSLSNSIGNKLELGVRSGAAYDDLGWSLNYVGDSINYREANDIRSNSIDGGLQYRVAPRLRVLGNVGYEKYDQVSGSDLPNGAHWSVGALWTPTNRTSLKATAGERFFGSSVGLDFSHRTRRTVWSLNYDETVSSTRSEFSLPLGREAIVARVDGLIANLLLDPTVRQNAIDLLSAFNQRTVISNQLFLQKRLMGSFVWSLPKHRLGLSIFSTTRDVNEIGSERSLLFGNSDFNISRFIKQSGASANWSWQFQPRTSLDSVLSVNRIDFTDVNRNDDLLLLSLGLKHQLTRKSTAGLEFRHQSRRTTLINSDYNENSIAAAVRLEF